MKPAAEYADWLERGPVAAKRTEIIEAIIEARNEAIDECISEVKSGDNELIPQLVGILTTLKEQNK